MVILSNRWNEDLESEGEMTYSYLPTYLFRFGSEWLSTRHDLTVNATGPTQAVFNDIALQSVDHESQTDSYNSYWPDILTETGRLGKRLHPSKEMTDEFPKLLNSKSRLGKWYVSLRNPKLLFPYRVAHRNRYSILIYGIKK